MLFTLSSYLSFGTCEPRIYLLGKNGVVENNICSKIRKKSECRSITYLLPKSNLNFFSYKMRRLSISLSYSKGSCEITCRVARD